MKKLNIVTRRNLPRLGQAVKELSTQPGSPCLECLVKASCTISFVDESACYEFAYFIQNMIREEVKSIDKGQEHKL